MKNTRLFKGCASAIATPFKSGKVDYKSFKKMLFYQEKDRRYKSGISAIVVSGTTGESASLSVKEKLSLLKTALENTSLPVIMGSGSNDTKKAIALSRAACAEGANALLVVTPYYNKTNSEGLIKHYFSIAEASEVPVIVYNVPSRTGYDIKTEDYLKLCKHENIQGIKEASGNVSKIVKLISLLKDEVNIYSGSDEVNLPLILSGAQGAISVTSNVCPSLTASVCEYALAGEKEKAEKANKTLIPLYDFLFCDVNPIPLKYALYRLGFCENSLRLPLYPLSEEKSKLYVDIP